LEAAAASGDLTTARTLVRFGADINYIGWDDDNACALAEAVFNKHPAMVSYLLSAGADVNEISSPGGGIERSPLGLAVLNDDLPMTRLLLEHHADPNAKACLDDPVLRYLKRNGPVPDTPIIQLLVQYGAKE
jgi:ankyrin repeat protein